MSTPEGLDNRKSWAELYRIVSIQANSLAELLSNDDLVDNQEELNGFSFLTKEFGINAESILTHLYKVYGTAYGVSATEFVMRGGFSRPHIHKHGE